MRGVWKRLSNTNAWRSFHVPRPERRPWRNLAHPGQDTLTNPIVLVEVFSDATREYDRGQKFTLYKEIPAFREYVLVEQEQVLVETFRWAASGSWEPRTCENLDAAILLESVNVSIPLRDIYRLVFD